MHWPPLEYSFMVEFRGMRTRLSEHFWQERLSIIQRYIVNIMSTTMRIHAADIPVRVRSIFATETVQAATGKAKKYKEGDIIGMKTELSTYFKSIIDQDRCAVVICNLEHEIIYMNQAAVQRYAKRGGQALVGKRLLDCHNPQSCRLIEKVISWFAQSAEHNIIYTSRNEKENKDVYMVALRGCDGELIGYYEKHEYRDRETAKLYDFG